MACAIGTPVGGAASVDVVVVADVEPPVRDGVIGVSAVGCAWPPVELEHAATHPATSNDAASDRAIRIPPG